MRYKDYKKVDITWLNEVPSHWEIQRIASVFDIRKEKNDPIKTEEVLSLSAKYGVTPYSEKKEKGGNKPKSDLTKYNLCYQGDILVNCMNVVAGAVGISNYFGAISPVYYPLVTNKYNNKYYMEYLFRNYDFQRGMVGLGKGIMMNESESGNLTTVRMRISWDTLKTLEVPVPPKEEQEQIKRFLDWKIKEIDRLIGGYRNKIQYINLIKSQLIANEYMKSDEKIRLKMLLKNDMEYGLNISGDISGDFRYVRITDIDKNGSLKETDQQYVSNFDKKYILNKGDILFARSGATVGKTYYYKETDGNCAYAGYLIRARVNKDLVYSEYIYYFTQSKIYEEWKNSIFIQSTIQNINAEKYSNLLIPMFDKDVQKKVIKNCKLIINLIDKIEKNQAQQINNLKLLKQSLISDVVTGKIDVRNVVIPEYDKVSDIEDDVILDGNFNEEV
ncbi:restriction endonuclease subunit S [Megasphaera vaginalis (ex Srinivasan et al. 2021)]|uniref:Type I restriction modification DNA specificity domain protein n=1 Tax=Megasphaera vaginalis (ex Srinivasan et al. 2021) TaxID=1111454 RepID=U7UNG6_9FIRM|nr:restriction endonuclease subunit S [Megasphaera vaginalis (ex Srinivasan et al. 2021)]ERT60028.1 type I restriction modification DNA specificity domain protein [Megasphaera vaginalis (ex Srinivasan et al. 2021)]